MMLFIKIFFWLFSFSSFAGSIETYKESIELETDNQKIAQDMVLSEVSRKLIISLLGKKEYQKQRSKIENRIIKNQNRYILSIDSTSGSKEETRKETGEETGKFRFVFNIKVSKSHLESLLKKEGFLKKENSSICLLPLISFSSHFEEEKQTWSWWNVKKEESSHNRELAQFFFDSLGKELTKIGFYFIDPVFQKTVKVLPDSLLPSKSHKMKYFKPIAQFYSCDTVLSGMIHVGKSMEGLSFLSNDFYSQATTKHWLQFVIRVFNIKTKENLFELTKQFPLEKKETKQLQEELNLKSQKMIESLIYRLSQEKDSLAFNRLMIAIQGDISYPEIEKIIKQIRRIDELKHIQPAYLSSQRAIYQAESSKSVDEVLKKIQALSIRAFTLKSRKSGKSKLELYVKRKSR